MISLLLALISTPYFYGRTMRIGENGAIINYIKDIGSFAYLQLEDGRRFWIKQDSLFDRGYLLQDGSRPLTDNWAAGTFNITGLDTLTANVFRTRHATENISIRYDTALFDNAATNYSSPFLVFRTRFSGC
jgi:hypothetical protein